MQGFVGFFVFGRKGAKCHLRSQEGGGSVGGSAWGDRLWGPRKGRVNSARGKGSPGGEGVGRGGGQGRAGGGTSYCVRGGASFNILSWVVGVVGSSKAGQRWFLEN